jgi:hypothetical protein
MPERKIKTLVHFHQLYTRYLKNNNISGKFYLVCDNVTDDLFDSMKENLPKDILHVRVDSKKADIKFQHQGHYSFYITSIDIVKNECKQELYNDYIFFCEDDWDYDDEAMNKSMSFLKSHKNSLISMFDHPDRYDWREKVLKERYPNQQYNTEISYDKSH